MSLADDSLAALDDVVARLDAGEPREGQRQMCAAVADSIDAGTHLLVEAGTGVGKSLAYLIPAVLSGQRVVVATATKALQDQLVKKDIPFLAKHLDAPFEAAVLKGRSNYLCLARLEEAADAGRNDDQLRLVPASRLGETIPALVDWAAGAESGERDDLPVEVPRLLWEALTVGPRECPGARGCPHVDDCFAEQARERARQAQLVVVNTHLYCLDSVIGGGLLGDHDTVIVDEAHTLDETASNVFGLSIGPGRFTWLSNQLKGLLVREATEIAALEAAGQAVGRTLDGLAGKRIDPGTGDLGAALVRAGEVVGGILGTVRTLDVPGGSEVKRQRVLQAADALTDELRRAAAPSDGTVSWVEASDFGISLRAAPVDVGPVLVERLFSQRTVVGTSATLSVGGEVAPTAWGFGLREGQGGDWEGLRVPSGFDYRRQAILYCPTHLPEPRADGFLDAAIDELAGLIEAAGGRTLALFTSYRAMHAAADALRDRWDWPVLVQDEGSRNALLDQFRTDEQSCLFATMGFWQGVDVPGDAARLVVIDKLPFARPDEPLVQARREAAEHTGKSGFEAVDLPRAARLLAQGVGRLIRSSSDRGVVAVLDRRLATARYRPAILESLPPLKRSVDRDEVHAFLTSLDVA